MRASAVPSRPSALHISLMTELQRATHVRAAVAARRLTWRIMRGVAAAAIASTSLRAQASTPAPPRAARAPTDSLVRDARAKAAAGDTATSLALLEIATDQSPRDVDALYWRGLLLSRTTTLSLADTPRRLLARRLLDRASEIDPRNPRYLIELGRIRLKTPLLRVEAERLFRKALAVAEANGDPVQLADVAWELGTVKERRYLTGRNRWLYTSPSVIFDPLAARAKPHYTREFLQNFAQPIDNAADVDRMDAEEYFRRALRALPTHAPSTISLMGLLYDQRRYDEMLRLAMPLVAADTAPPRVLFAAGLGAYRLGAMARADTLFSRALARFAPAERNELTHLGRITRKGDSVRIDGLNDADRAETDAAFWEAADPLLSTPENEARLEFLARLAYADLRFTDPDMRQIGWRTDRGTIITRYGEPPVVATFAPTSDADAADAVGRVITVWFYPRTEIEFVFTGPPAMNVASFAGNHRGFAEQQREQSPFLLDNLPVALAVDTIPVQLARFRGPVGTAGATTQLVVAASFPTDRMYAAAELDRGMLEASLRVGPASALRLRRADTLAVSLPAAARARRVWVDTVAAGADVRVRVEARDAAVQSASARSLSELTMPQTSAAAATMMLSDLMIADRLPVEQTTVGRWADIGLSPRGDLTVAPRDTFALYWESYGLASAGDGRVNYGVRILVTLEEIDRGPGTVRRLLGGLSDVVGLSPEGDAQLGLRFERTAALAARDRVPDLVTLGLGSAPAGRYRLDLEVTDRTTGTTAQASRRFHIRREPSS